MAEAIGGIVFDCDGLLLDTESAWTRGEVVLCRQHGVEFTLEHKQELLGTGAERARKIFERHLGLPGAGDRLGEELIERVAAEVAREAPPMPGAVELVTALRAEGIPIGLASNSPRVMVELALRTAGLDGAFDALVTAEEVERPKPEPHVYLALVGKNSSGQSSTSLSSISCLPHPLPLLISTIWRSRSGGVSIKGIPRIA